MDADVAVGNSQKPAALPAEAVRVVDELRLRHVPNFKTLSPNLPAQVSIFKPQKKAFVKIPRLFQYTAAREQAEAEQPVGRRGGAVVHIFG